MPSIERRTDFPAGGGCARPAALIAAAAVAALVLGCGKKGPPLPPLPGSTPRVIDLEVRQIGGSAHASFTLPRRPGAPLVDYQTRSVELWRRPKGDGPPARPPAPRPAPKGADGTPLPPEMPLGDFVDDATLVASVAGDAMFDFLSRPTLTLIDPSMAAGSDGDPVEYAVILKTDVRRAGTVSNLAEIRPLPAPPTPADVTAASTEGAVQISWTMPAVEAPMPADAAGTESTDASGPAAAPAPAPRVNVYRATAGDPIPAEPVDGSPFAAPPYRDTGVSPGVTHRYVLRAVITADGRTIESDATGEIVVVYVDEYAPATPRGLRLIPEGRRINLVWNPGEERDLGGYHVYRRIAAGPWERIDVAPIPSATFTDENVPAGRQIEYAVTAHDKSTPPNESEKSQAVRASVEDP